MSAAKVIWLKTPLSVKWYVTSKCNLRCKHCYLPEYKRHPDREKILRLIDAFCDRKVRFMSILGGEPTIRPDLEVMIEKMTSRNVQVNMSSNGTLIDANRARSLKAAGLRRIQISLEGPSAEVNDEIRGRQTFEKACRAIEHLRANDFHVTIAYTLNHKNYVYLRQMYDFTKQIGAQRLRLEVYVPLGHGAAHRDRYSLDAMSLLEIKKEIIGIDQIAVQSGVELKSPFYQAGTRCQGCSTFGCGAATTTLIVNSDFTISPCDLNAWHDRSARPMESISDFDDIWQNDPAFRKWRGQGEDKLFRDVHQHACHASYLSYGQNIFERHL